ncbi:hypothetical protein HZS_1641 [Henneguya salminicola]|nr:hypothetical protein HZS_1641 [Henneguya salminicola]
MASMLFRRQNIFYLHGNKLKKNSCSSYLLFTFTNQKHNLYSPIQV